MGYEGAEARRGKAKTRMTPEEARQRRQEGMARRSERLACTHDVWEKVAYMSGGAGTYYLRCSKCGKVEMTKQFQRERPWGKKVRG